MKGRRFTVVVEWRDGEVEDCDEVTVIATNRAGATSAAKKKWKKTVGRDYPTCVVLKTYAITPEWRLGFD